MTDFKQGDVIRLRFPYTDKSTRQHRPALVVSKGRIGENGALLGVMMITSAENRSWEGDLSLGEAYHKAGLPSPSVIRTCKIATNEACHAERLGQIRPALMSEVKRALISLLGIEVPI